MRIEHDSLGSMELPDEWPFGIHTARARDNFAFNAEHMRLDIFEALIVVKKAAARANAECGLLDETRAGLIEAAADEVLASSSLYVPPLHPLQGGAGTSTNMAANELLANLAQKRAGHEYGSGYILPLEHVNLSQSTNDVYPTAVRIALLRSLTLLETAVRELLEALHAKEKDFAGILKIGRTELQDAMPLALGQEFGAWADALARFRWRIDKARDWVREVNIGGTAVGTGVNADPVYTARVIEHLRRMSLQPLSRARNLIDATQNTDQLVEISGLIRTGTVSLKKMCADLRLLSSGPACGLNELDLPALQAGSSIMPGKVNPVMCEAVEQICISIMAGDQGLAMAAAESNLELPQFLPYIAHTLLSNIDMLAAACQRLAPCIAGITANERQIALHLDHSAAVMTLLSPVIGYDQAAALVHEAHERSVSATNLAVEKGFVTREQLHAIRRPEYMAAPGYIEDKLERDGHLPQ